MISTNGREILKRFVGTVKSLLMDNITTMLQRDYGIWAEGRIDPDVKLTTSDPDIKYRAKLLRQRIKYLKSNLPVDSKDIDKQAVRQLTAEQAFTVLNRFCALRMCEERGLILESVGHGYDSEGFTVYDAVTGQGATAPTFQRYSWYLRSIFDELSVELPAVFDRFSPYGLIDPDENTLMKLFELINDPSLTEYYDPQNGEVVNFWKENETLGWIFQYYNSIDERRRMRDESDRPRNSREMAVRNQFFTPDYVVRFLTDNSLGRIWYEMTGGNTSLADKCEYMIRRPDEEIKPREIKDPAELLMLDPACGSMHFGLYTYEVMEAIYLDAWDNHPELWQQSFRYEYATRDEFQVQIPRLILENNIHGVEIDPRALQIAALSLWLRAQQSWSEMGIERAKRPTITRSHLVLAEAMPGNKKMLRLLTEDMEKPMQKLILKVWEKMTYVGEAGLLIKMEEEIASEIEELRKNWAKIHQEREVQLNNLFSTEDEKKQWQKEQRLLKEESKAAFFADIQNNLQEALRKLSEKLSDEEGYENSLFANDAVRGFSFIELCQKKYDVILMNPPFGEGSENTVYYLDTHYCSWCRNLVCAFFCRTQELLNEGGLVGSIFDRTVLIKSSYENFRKDSICGNIEACADTGWGVLDAQVETSTLLLSKNKTNNLGWFCNILEIPSEQKSDSLRASISGTNENVYLAKSIDFSTLPNSIIGYYFSEDILEIFKNKTLEQSGFVARKGHDFVSNKHPRLYYEVLPKEYFYHFYNGGSFNMFYMPSRDVVFYDENIIRADKSTNLRNSSDQLHQGTGFGKRGDILDAHILKNGTFFSAEGLAIPNISSESGLIGDSFLNSIYSQYVINLYCAQHKGNGYVNLLPIPKYSSKADEIIRIVSNVIDIKRYWQSYDETNIEYRGIITYLEHGSIKDALLLLQERLYSDAQQYYKLTFENDETWMELAAIDEHNPLRQTLFEYKTKRPSEELITIDGASNNNVLNTKVMAQEIIQELVGFAFGRWDISYAMGKELPEFGGIFDELPFMPKVSLDAKNLDGYVLDIPSDGILVGNAEHRLSIVSAVRAAMRAIWKDNADDIEFELCQLIGTNSLQEYFDAPNGFFDYHLKRYTKSRRKAPIYWPITSPNGGVTVWCYYPRMDANTLPKILLLLAEERNSANSELMSLLGSGDRRREEQVRNLVGEIEALERELNRVNDLPYKPNHDDGVPVTAAPLCNTFRHTAWRNECNANMSDLADGEYDWSHLAYTIYPDRIRTKVRKDWCLALTHGLEELCENKPKEKKPRKKKDATPEETLFD